ncbi:MAG: DUF429 domain-containing protein [Chloroflexi bacterium]|nr:DUF429 domain-containing protein [Chloroflexota bacterium]
MLFTDTLFTGIDLASGRKSITYAALDKGLHVIALADGSLDDVTAFLAGQSSAVTAVNAPSGLNRGLVRAKMKKETLTPIQIRKADLRAAEHELRQRGIMVARTHSTLSVCPAWMKAGFGLYRKLEKAGFTKYPETNEAYQVMETNPLAGFAALAGVVPLAKSSIEGRLQRQLILYECGLQIKDPMDVFEEITRYKISKGIWPAELLYSVEQLDALVAAYTAWMAVERREKTVSVGDAEEGQIMLPVAELKERY